ncbi:MAG: InlB B-repeat-containing protein [Bacteroidales bacterium]|nr:InlB B-repeat-containing protein [Bacteroidales bacterium]
MKRLLFSFVMLIAAVGAWAEDVLLQDAGSTKFVNMPHSGSNTLTLSDASVMTFKVYDSGGVESQYSNYSEGYLLITAPEGYALQLTGTVQTETNYDYLTVYDGTTNEAAVLRENLWSLPSDGDLTDIGSIISTGRSLLLYFHSDGGTTRDGLDIDVTLFNPNEAFPININAATGGVMHSSKATSKYNEEITLTWTHETGYVLESITITDAYGRPVSFTGGSWYNAATHFTMPTSAVTVTPTFVKATTSVEGLFLNFPETGQTKTCDIATGVTSFKVYDDGGAEGEYSDDYTGYVIITAPEGLRMQLTGTITGESNDQLTVYDGTTDEAALLLDHLGGNGDNSPARDIGIITTTGNSMMLYFRTDGSQTDPGLDLEVTLFDPTEAFPVNISTVTGGSMTSDKSTALFTETIALTEAHEDGYVLKDILVKDVNDRIVEVEGGTWYKVDASFTMPASEVTVTPTFIPATTIADGLFINMLKEGTITTNISTGVKSFKVYDNGGAEGEYSDGCNSYLVLNVPEGYQIQVTGTIDAENCDYLTFYDGADDQAPTLREQVTSIDSHNLSDIGIVTSSGRSMTIHFHSDGSQTDDGYALNVYVFNPNEPQPITISPATGGAMASDVPSAKFNDVVTLTETHQRGYTLENTTAVDANGTPVAINGGTWYNAAASFNMPISGVTVTPTFTTGTTAEDGLFINMPKEGTLTTDICNGIKSFKVYDDGGATGEYSDYCQGYLLLQAPIGYRLKVSGTIASENNCDYLYIYDGTEVDEAKCLLKEFSSPNENNKQPTDIGEHGSTARTLLLYFRTDGSQTAAGLDLTVELIPITYTLAFDNGQAGATGIMAIAGSMESITLTYDDPKNLPATGFSRTGYDFLGWSATVNGDVVYADQAVVENLATEQGAEVTIYAKWQPIVYPITYELAGGAVATANPVEYTIETADFTLVKPTKLGYTFTGWEGTDLTEKTVAVTVTTGHYGDRTYTATWEPNPYKVHFDINGGNGGTMADQIHIYDSELALTENAFTRTGYTFKEWNSKADGSGTVYTDKQTVKNLTAVRDEVITMYAQWTPNPYQVAFNANNGTGSMANEDFVYDTAKNLTENVFTRRGYTFEGWNTQADGNGDSYADKASVKNLTAELNGIVDLYAQWQVITYTISYDLAGGSVATANPTEFTVETETFTLVNPTRTGYIFDGWTGYDLSEANKTVTIAKGSIDNRSYVANWTPITYQIAFHANNGTGTMANQVFTYDVAQALTQNIFTRTGYTYEGWNTKADGSGTPYTDKQELLNLTAENGTVIDVYAQWQIIPYTVTYDLAGGSVATANPTEYNVETATFTLTNPTREGYDFGGWEGTGITGTTTTVTIATGSYGNRTYTATWTPIVYDITYNLADGSVATANPTSYTIETETFTLTNPTKAHWIFKGWTGTGLSAAAQTMTIAKGSIGTRAYTATWEREVYTVSITSNLANAVTASTTSPQYEDDVVLTIADDEDYDLVSLTVDGVDVTSQISGGQYTINSVSANVSVVATFNANKAFITMAHAQQTFSCTQPLDFTGVTGLKAYIASGYIDGTVVLTRVDKVPASSGLFLVGTEGAEYKVPFAASSAFYSNLLKPVLTAQTVPSEADGCTNFLYSEVNGVKGFYKSSGSGTVAAGKAYLQLPTSALSNGVKAVGFIFEGDETGIDATEFSGRQLPTAVYDMAGRKVADTFDAKKLPQGVYIVNGKKIAIK